MNRIKASYKNDKFIRGLKWIYKDKKDGDAYE